VSQPLQDDKEFAKPVPIELSPTSQKIPISWVVLFNRLVQFCLKVLPEMCVAGCCMWRLENALQRVNIDKEEIQYCCFCPLCRWTLITRWPIRSSQSSTIAALHHH
jgi:hypothetical protein